MTPLGSSAAREANRLERASILTFCAIGAGLALGFYLARGGQRLLLEWVGIVQPGLGSYLTLRELSRAKGPRLRLIATGALLALASVFFGVPPTVRWVAGGLASLLCLAALARRYRSARALTVALCALLVGAKIHAVFGPPATWP